MAGVEGFEAGSEFVEILSSYSLDFVSLPHARGHFIRNLNSCSRGHSPSRPQNQNPTCGRNLILA